MLSEPPIGVILNFYFISHNLSPILKRSIKICSDPIAHDFVPAVGVFNELIYFSVHAWNVCYFENRKPLFFVLVKKLLHKENKVWMCALGKWVGWTVMNYFVEDARDAVTVKRLFEC